VFQLDPEQIATRARASGQVVHLPTLRESILRGTIGFTLVSLGGFAPWILAGRWFYRNTGEIGLYVACAIAFIGLSGPLLHRLIIGPGSLRRCYQLFSTAFIAYAVAWTLGWMLIGGWLGGVIGALAGVAVMGGMLAWGFGTPGAALKVVLALFVTNVAGYFIGEWGHNSILTLKEGNSLGLVLDRSTRALLSKGAWGLLYGMGFGAGIGWGFHLCQTRARRLLSQDRTSDEHQNF